MTRRRLIVGLLVIVLASGAIIGVVLASARDTNDGLSKQKVGELAERDMTPADYIRIKRKGEAVEAKNKKALETGPSPDPNVVAPRLIREVHSEELLAWKQFFVATSHEEVTESWSVHVLSEKRTVASLELVTRQHRDLLPEPAEWVFHFSLTGPGTPAEQRIANRPHAVEALTRSARTLERLPAPRMGRGLPVELYATEDLGPGLNKIFVDTPQPEAYKPWLMMRGGSRDEALQRGESLAKHITHKIQELKLNKHVEVFLEPVANTEGGRVGHRRRSSIYGLIRLFNQGPVPMILRWKTGARTGASLLRRPVQQLILLP